MGCSKLVAKSTEGGKFDCGVDFVTADQFEKFVTYLKKFEQEDGGGNFGFLPLQKVVEGQQIINHTDCCEILERLKSEHSFAMRWSYQLERRTTRKRRGGSGWFFMSTYEELLKVLEEIVKTKSSYLEWR